MVMMPPRLPDRSSDSGRPAADPMSAQPLLVRFRQAMPEYGPRACQERLGPQCPDGYEIHREISD